MIGRLMRRMSLTRTHHATVVGPIRFSNRSNNCRVCKINGRRSSLVRTHHATIVFCCLCVQQKTKIAWCVPGLTRRPNDTRPPGLTLTPIGLYRDVWNAAIASSRKSLTTLSVVMRNTSQCKSRSLRVNSGMSNVMCIVMQYTSPPNGSLA